MNDVEGSLLLTKIVDKRYHPRHSNQCQHPIPDSRSKKLIGIVPLMEYGWYHQSIEQRQ